MHTMMFYVERDAIVHKIVRFEGRFGRYLFSRMSQSNTTSAIPLIKLIIKVRTPRALFCFARLLYRTSLIRYA